MKTITIEGHLRTETGKASTRQVRSQENVPGVIYGGAKEVAFFTSAKELRPLVYTSKFQLAEVKIGGDVYKTIIKDLQFDKVKDQLIHVDMMELVEDRKLIATIPIKLTGNSVGVRSGGKLIHKLKALKVKCLPKDLKESIGVDISNLQVNGNVRVEDIPLENMEVMNSPRIPVASVVMTRQLRQEEAASAK